MTYKQFSESVELDEKTVIEILNLNAIPSSTFLEKFTEVHGINACWVLTGVGRPYLPDEEKSGEPIDEPGSVDPVSAVSEEDKFETRGEMVYFQTTARVLRSESDYVDTLVRLIKSHRKDLKAEDFTTRLENEIKRTRARINELEKEMGKIGKSGKRKSVESGKR